MITNTVTLEGSHRTAVVAAAQVLAMQSAGFRLVGVNERDLGNILDLEFTRGVF